jgi:hypothetical protein
MNWPESSPVKRLWHIERWIVDPLWILSLALAAQALVWWLWMPVVPTIEGAAPRYFTTAALVRYAALFACLVGGILMGKLAAGSLVRRRGADAWSVAPGRLASFERVARWALLLSLAGEVVYVLPLFRHPEILQAALAGGGLTPIGDFVKSQRVIGLSSLNNLFVVCVAVYALLAFHPRVEAPVRRRHRLHLVLLGVVVLAHALLLTARMFFVYYVTVLLAAFLLTREGDDPKLRRVIWRTLAALAVVVWLGETLREGANYGRLHDVSAFSPQAQAYVGSRLVEGYIGADFNNAMVLLASRPSMKLVSTAEVFRRVAEAAGLGVGTADFGSLPQWKSSFATVNVLGLWWFDAGWLAAGIAVAVGWWLGGTYVVARRGIGHLPFPALFFLISYPGLFSMTRVNYFGLTIFVAPFAFLMFVYFLWSLQTLASYHRQTRASPG